MIKKLPGETWKKITFSGYKQHRYQYAISNQGRLASFKKDINKDGKLLSGSMTTGYRTLNLHRPDNKGTLYIHREIARIFLKKKSPKHKYVIHLNHNKLDNQFKNLRWATLEQMILHQQTSPAKIAYKVRQANRKVGLKLNATQVKKIKSILHNSNRNITIKQLAGRYAVSEMTLYRIKSGENWGRI